MAPKTMDRQADDLATDVETTERTEMTKDDLFHVLQNERRRQVLRYVITNGPGPFEMRSIAEQVAAWEHDTTLQALTSKQRQRVYIALYQSHLPKLDEQGLIDYNQSRGIVEARPLLEETVDHLSIPDEELGAVDAGDANDDAGSSEDDDGSSWKEYFLGATVASVLLVVGVWLSLVPVPLSGLSVATLVVGMFGTLTAGMFGWSEQ